MSLDTNTTTPSCADILAAGQTPPAATSIAIATDSARAAMTVGSAIMPWAIRTKDQPAGWAIPGGERTASEDTARVIAGNMHRLMELQKLHIAGVFVAQSATK